MAKGGNFEREVAKDLSLWWTENERDDVFWHTGGSGARATTRKKFGKDTKYQFGDISFTDPIGKPLIDRWNIECKTGYGKSRKKNDKRLVTNWCVLDVIDSKQQTPVFIEFWEQCRKDAEESGREPILIFRRNQMQKCIVLTSREINRLWEMLGSPYRSASTIQVNGNLIIMNLSDFLVWSINLPFLLCEGRDDNEDCDSEFSGI